jgi:hypothetical protein
MAQQPPAPPPPPPIPGLGAPGRTPAPATTAAILLFTVGGVRALLALIGFVAVIGAGDELSDLDVEDVGVFVGIVVGVLIITVVAAVLQIIGGIHTLKLRPRGFALGLAGSIIGIVLGLLGFAGAASGASNPAGIVFGILLFIGDIVILVYLGQARRLVTPE